MAAIGNDVLRRAFDGADLTQRVRPVIAVEEFNAACGHVARQVRLLASRHKYFVIAFW